MGFLARLLGGTDPTRAWVADPSLVLYFDLDKHALCGVRLGDPIERLSPLGPAEHRGNAREGLFSYFSRGLEFEAENGIISLYALVWASMEARGFKPFGGACWFQGRKLDLSARTRETELVRVFGEPYQRDVDEGEVLLVYKHQGVDWEIEISPRGTLNDFTLMTTACQV
jgi:hypothetical protein